ncbi:MAG: dihydroorotate dehydrogenase [Saccharofermentanales bacterium]
MGLNTEIRVNGLIFKNPVIPASGTFNFGREMAELYDLSVLGGMVSKGLTLSPRKGNPSPRIAESSSGMLNSVGLQNPGIDHFIEYDHDFFCSQGCISIVNAAGSTEDEYVQAVIKLNETDCDIIELNLSCPNVTEGCMIFGSSPRAVGSVVSKVRKETSKPIWVKLTPNTGDVTAAALAAEAEGADGISLINTLLGLAVDISSGRPVIRNNYAGLSGPAIKPVALRMVNQVYLRVGIPVIGMGGIASADDVIEFMMAGASLVQIGTANINDPYACIRIIEDLPDRMLKYGINDLQSLTGSLRLWDQE